MSGRSSPVNGEYDAATAEPTMRLTVRKDLFPEVRIPKLSPAIPHQISISNEDVSCVKLETDFEKSIDDIAHSKLQTVNGVLLSPIQPRHRKHKQHSRHASNRSTFNGNLPLVSKYKKSHYSQYSMRPLQVKGGKNLNLVTSSDCAEEDRSVDSDSSDDKVLQPIVKLPYTIPRQSGKPYSHKISQLSTKKSKSKNIYKEKRTHNIIPCSGKPRSMLSICSSRSKKKSKKSECTATYQSQIVDTNTNIKIKIKKTNIREVVTPTPTSIADLGQRKSKKKRAASPVASESSGEEYDPSRGDTAASMSVAAPKPRHPPSKSRKTNKPKNKSEKTERSRVSLSNSKDTGPQSPWAQSIPEEILVMIFEYIVNSQGTLPTIIRLGRVCKLWHSVSCRPELWKNVDLAQYTSEKCKTDYKLVWLLENRLSHCQSLNIAQWKVCNIPWVLACIADYCPNLVELGVAGWSRLSPDQLFDLVQGLPKLQRLDLSHTSETGGSSTCLSSASVARLAENCGPRLTHLTLANNMFTALPQILTTLATSCPNLEVLDISGARATSHPALVPLEALQRGCPKMRVFRAANAQLVLASATTSQQMDAVGWSQLEELSIAGEAAAERVGVGEYRLGDEALSRLVRGATRLRLLDLRGLHRLSDSGLVRVPAWDLQHLFLGGCNVTRQSNACLELICEKWSHSLLELDLSWASAERALDDAVSALADASSSKLRILNLCGSSVSLEPVKKVLLKCSFVESINLSSCRALPRGMKRLYTGKELQDLKDSLDPQKAKTKENENKVEKKKKDVKKSEADSKSEIADESKNSDSVESCAKDKPTSPSTEEPKSVPESITNISNKQEAIEVTMKSSPDSKSQDISTNKSVEIDTETFEVESSRSTRGATPKLLSPVAQAKPDSSSTPTSVPSKTEFGSPHFSPVPKPDSLVQNSPEVQMDSSKNNSSWNLGHIKTTPTHKNERNLNKIESYSKLKHAKLSVQCSPTTSLENKPSPETSTMKQDIKNPNSWNYGNYSPMPKQDTQFSSQRSPYSAQPSPAQPSPYSAQPSPYSTQPSPYSSQPSPYSAQPSPDTSQIVKPDIQKSGSWNTGNFSPMPKHHSPFSPHPSTHASPDPGMNMKGETLRNNSSRTPGHYSPMSRQDRIHNSPYSPISSMENVAYSNKKSPGMGNYSPMMRNDCHLTCPDGAQSRPVISGGRQQQDMFGRPVNKLPELIQNIPSEHNNSWGMERFNQIGVSTAGIESLVWDTTSYSAEPPPRVELPTLLHTPPPQQHAWSGLPSFESARRPNEDLCDSWTLGQFRMEPPHQLQNFVEQNISFDSLIPQSYLDDSFTETSRVD